MNCWASQKLLLKLQKKNPLTMTLRTLIFIANVVLVCGIIASLICLFTIVWVRNPAYTYVIEYMFNSSGFATTIMILISSLVSWSFMKVLANISLTLKDINKKMK